MCCDEPDRLPVVLFIFLLADLQEDPDVHHCTLHGLKRPSRSGNGPNEEDFLWVGGVFKNMDNSLDCWPRLMSSESTPAAMTTKVKSRS